MFPHGICVTIHRVGDAVPCLRSVGAVATSKSRVVKICTGHISILFNSITALLFLQVFVHTHTRIVVDELFFLDSQFFCGNLMFDIVQCDIVQNVGAFAGRSTTQHGQSQSYGVTVL